MATSGNTEPGFIDPIQSLYDIIQTLYVILVIDYAFGTQAYEIMDELLSPAQIDGRTVSLRIASISIMGKAGTLPGQKGDIMLASAHVMEGTPHNYILSNDLSPDDFGGKTTVYCGPMVTVMGTSLQNRDVLKRFYDSSWRAIGLEMEGGHYQRAINAAIIQGPITVAKGALVRFEINAWQQTSNPDNYGYAQVGIDPTGGTDMLANTV